MDEVVRQIYSAIETQDHLHSTLLVLCGDHGMNDAGNHGGSAPGETSPALVFMSPKLRRISGGHSCPVDPPKDDFQYYEVVDQSDIAPTLAGMLGFPVPLNNLGVFIPSLLGIWSNGMCNPVNEIPQAYSLVLEQDTLTLLQRNAHQVSNIAKATFGQQFLDKERLPVDCENPMSNTEELQCLWHGTDISDKFQQHTEQADAKLQVAQHRREQNAH